VAHTGWHWLVERFERLALFPWPALDASALATLLRAGMVAVAIAAAAWAWRVWRGDRPAP